ncbi:MAG: hypothetical protein HY674_21280, partial [Chloroflexi bacterium]|nr:hypothetical protein [Chloroflexota bacterium]
MTSLVIAKWMAAFTAAVLGATDAPSQPHDITVQTLRCEYLVNPLGIDTPHPRLSWVIESTRRGQRPTAYRVLVASAPELLAKDQGDLWDSGKVASDQSIQVEYAGQP